MKHRLHVTVLQLRSRLSRLRVWVLLPVWLFSCVGEVYAQAKEPAVVQRISYTTAEGSGQVVIFLSHEVTYRTSTLPPDTAKGLPARFYVDLAPAGLGRTVPVRLPVREMGVERVRTAQFNPTTVRVVLDVEEVEDYRVFSLTDPYRVVVEVKGGASQRGKARTEESKRASSLLQLTEEEKIDSASVALARLQERVAELEKKQAVEAKGEGKEKRSFERRVKTLERESEGRTGRSNFIVTGFGSANYIDPRGEKGNFGVAFNPVFLYRMGDNILFESELEFELENDETEVELEYAQIDWTLNDHLTLVGGKFLLPFNAFGERLHPTWVNKLPSVPIFYGHHAGGRVLLPILSDVGVQVRGGVNLPWGMQANYSLYAVQGPRIDEHGDEHGEEAEEEMGMGPVPTLEFGRNFDDNNNNKALGFRFGLLPISNAEIGFSFMEGAYDDAGDLNFNLLGVDIAYQQGPFRLFGEWIRQTIDIERGGNVTRDGFYLQPSYRLTNLDWDRWVGAQLGPHFKRLELVFRYGLVDSTDEDQFTWGMNYWLSHSTPLKVAYELNRMRNVRDDSRILFQIAHGF